VTRRGIFSRLAARLSAWWSPPIGPPSPQLPAPGYNPRFGNRLADRHHEAVGWKARRVITDAMETWRKGGDSASEVEIGSRFLLRVGLFRDGETWPDDVAWRCLRSEMVRAVCRFVGVASPGDGCRIEREAGNVKAVLYVTLHVPVIIDRGEPFRKRA